jgi:transcription initiation factor TFIID subunit 13
LINLLGSWFCRRHSSGLEDSRNEIHYVSGPSFCTRLESAAESMSYPHYTPPAGGHPTSTTYPYGTYHPGAYSSTAGAYTYQTPAYQTGVTGYGWPTYPYGYLPHPLHTGTAGTATAQTATAVTAQPQTTTTLTPTVAPQRPATLTAYTPTYTRDNVTTATTTTAAPRAARKQANFKGLFAKEREFVIRLALWDPNLTWSPVKSLMYGFGDDRNPANDTVSVMEEILVEYITDVVSISFFYWTFTRRV